MGATTKLGLAALFLVAGCGGVGSGPLNAGPSVVDGGTAGTGDAEASDTGSATPGDAGNGDAMATPPTKTCSTTPAAFNAFVTAVGADLASMGVTGAAVSVVCGTTVYSAGIGQTATSGGQPVTGHTRFNVGSTQKAFTAAAALRLVEEGTLALDDPASKWAPGINTSQPYGTSCTLAQLLSHVSGYPAVPPASAENDTDLVTFFQDQASQQLWSPPGVVFDYSNEGFELAGLLMQNAAGAPFADLVQSRVFGPAGMVDAQMDPSLVQSQGNFATGYSSGMAVQPSDLVDPVEGPDTGAWASAADLAQFARTLMSGGGPMLQPASVTRMTTVATQTDDPGQQYGYGMFLMDFGGTPMWTHGGDNTGYVTDLTIYPTYGFATSLLVANDGAYPPHSYYGAFQTFLGTTLPLPPDDSFDNADMPEHAGTYQSVALGPIDVVQTGTTMTITIGGQTATMTPVWKDAYTFNYAAWGADIEVNFWRVSGHVTYAVTRAGVGAKM